MGVNLHAQRVALAHGRSYHEVREAVNILVGWGVANRDEAEQWVEEWAAQGVDDLRERAREEVDEAARSQ